MTKTWTVHGLWPNLGSTTGPKFCNKSWKFDVSKIEVSHLLCSAHVTQLNCNIRVLKATLTIWIVTGVVMGEGVWDAASPGLRGRQQISYVSALVAKLRIACRVKEAFIFTPILPTIHQL